MIGAVSRGEVVTSIAGVAINRERNREVDFALGVVESERRAYVKVPDGNSVSWTAFTDEFKVSNAIMSLI